MNYALLKQVIDLVEEFENQKTNTSEVSTIDHFKKWIILNNHSINEEEYNYEGKDKGRSLDSVLNTLLVHLGRYAKFYSKSAISNSIFSTQEDFIFLITLKTFGPMTKMDLIKKNIQDKPGGIQIINRLLNNGLVTQTDDMIDKRSKIISISDFGLEALENQMVNIRNASKIVGGNLTEKEKKELIMLLEKLENFHQPLYLKNIESNKLLDTALDYLGNYDEKTT